MQFSMKYNSFCTHFVPEPWHCFVGTRSLLYRTRCGGSVGRSGAKLGWYCSISSVQTATHSARGYGAGSYAIT